MTNDKLNVGVLGLGRIGKIHIENLAKRIPGAEVVAVCDVSAHELDAVKARYKIGKTSSDYREVLELPDVDAVVICTPTSTHCPILLDAAAAQKHVFCEKPIDLSIAKIDSINDAFQKAGTQLMVGFNRRFDPHFLKMHEMVKSGKTGSPHILKITSRDPSPPPEGYIRLSGGIFLDMTIHDFDMARYLMGSEITEVYAKANVLVDRIFEKLGDWDTAITNLTFQSGALGTIDNSRRAVYGYDQRVEVFGSEGMVAIENARPDNHVCLDREGTHAPLPLNFFMERYAESYLREMQAFVASILENQAVPVTGNDGRAAVAIGLAAAESAKQNRPVKLDEIRAASQFAA